MGSLPSTSTAIQLSASLLTAKLSSNQVPSSLSSGNASSCSNAPSW